MKNQIALVVLAAGESKRLGRPKQLIPYKKSFLLQCVLEEMEKVNYVDRFIVLGSSITKIKNVIPLASWEIIENKEWKDGIGKSIATAVDKLRNQYDEIVFILGDQYKCTGSHIEKLLSKKQENKICITHTGDSLSPPVLWPSKFYDKLARLTDDSGAKHIIREEKEQLIIIKNTAAKWDVDKEEDVPI